MITAIIKTITNIISTIVKIIMKILKVFRLQFLAIVLLIGVILFLTDVLPSNTSTMKIMYVAFGLSVLYTVTANYNRLKKPVKKKEKDKAKEKPTEKVEETKVFAEEKQVDSPIIERYPKYYNVRQNRNYIMAEYKDRYELFLKKDGKLLKIRTDFKRDIR